VDAGPRYRALSVELGLSYYEIYNERVFDLLSAQPETACRVREDAKVSSALDHTATPHARGRSLTVTPTPPPPPPHLSYSSSLARTWKTSRGGSSYRTRA